MVKTQSSIKKAKKTVKSISNRSNELIKFGYSETKSSPDRFKKLISFSYEKGIQNTIGALMDLINKNFRNPTFVKKLIKDIDNLRKWIMKYNIKGGGPKNSVVSIKTPNKKLNMTSNSKSQVLKQLKDMLSKLKNITSIEKIKSSMSKMPTIKNTTNKLKNKLSKSISSKNNKSSQNNKLSKKNRKTQSCNNCMKEKCTICSKKNNKKKIANTIKYGINSVTHTNTKSNN